MSSSMHLVNKRSGFIGDFEKINHLPSSNEAYNEQEYWDERYKEEESFDWFVGYSKIRDLILRHVNINGSVLNLGCGNSNMPMEMIDDGFHDITNLDYSPVVIETMSKKTNNMAGLKWVVGDINKLEFRQERFDTIIEKGTLDALLVSEKDPWNYSEEAESTLDRILSQVSSLLKPCGKFISVTFCQPHFRLPFYACTKYGWSVTAETIGSSFHYFCYVLTKGEELSSADQLHRVKYLERKLMLQNVIKDDKSISSDEDEDYLFRVKQDCYDDDYDNDNVGE